MADHLGRIRRRIGLPNRRADLPGIPETAPADPEYYQTTYGSCPGAVLFPSAGRHFTPAMLSELEARGVAIAEVTLLIAARSHYWVRSAFRQRVAEGAVGDVEAEGSGRGACSRQPYRLPSGRTL
jgi:S-adenosylmethionine:tRNA ribosyltransferase-isomerase